MPLPSADTPLSPNYASVERTEQPWTYAHLPKLPITNLLEKDAVAFEAKEYLGSLLTQREKWAVWSKAVGPEMFVTVVSDQFVFVGKLPNGPKLDQFAKTVADDCSHQQRCISPHIYRFSDGQWVVAVIPHSDRAICVRGPVSRVL